MKVLYNEDFANHVSPESCGVVGNHMAEALTGEHAGGLLSSEITKFRVGKATRLTALLASS